MRALSTNEVSTEKTSAFKYVGTPRPRPTRAPTACANRLSSARAYARATAPSEWSSAGERRRAPYKLRFLYPSSSCATHRSSGACVSGRTSTVAPLRRARAGPSPREARAAAAAGAVEADAAASGRFARVRAIIGSNGNTAPRIAACRRESCMTGTCRCHKATTTTNAAFSCCT